MTENKRYIDDGFDAIEDQSFTDTETDKTYYVDYFDEIVDLVNEQDKTIKELKKENENLNNVLEDFMGMLNRLQANPDNEVLQSMAKDMLQLMGKDIMGDLND